MFIPVDMPRLSRPVLEALVDTAGFHPDAHGAAFAGGDCERQLPIALARRVLPVVSSQLDAGRLRLGDALDLLDLAIVAPDGAAVARPDEFANINTPSDLEPARPFDGAESGNTGKSMEERSMDLEKCLAAVRELGAGHVDPVAPTEAEVAALLDFTRAVAHAGERKDAPLAAFAMGVAMARLEPAERAAVLTKAAQAVDRAAGNTEG